MIGIMHHLTPEEKIAQALLMSQQGLSRQEIADQLYQTDNKKSRLSALRKLMGRNGYGWSDEQRCYIVNKQTETNNNNDESLGIVHTVMNQTTSITNDDEQTETNNNVTYTVSPLPQEQVEGVLTPEDVILIKEFVTQIKTFPGGLQGLLGGTQVIGTAELLPETPKIEFTKFTGALQGSTIQLHHEVWKALDEFSDTRKISKKVIVNEAIWQLLQKWSK